MTTHVVPPGDWSGDAGGVPADPAGPVGAMHHDGATARFSVDARADDPTLAMAGDAATSAWQPPAPREPSIAVFALAGLVGTVAVLALVSALGLLHPTGTGVALGAAALALAFAAAGVWAFRRRGAGAFLAVAVLMALVSLGAAAVGDRLDDGVGRRTLTPLSVEDLRATHRLGAGNLVIDLRRTPLPARPVTVRARVVMGELTVIVPPGVRVRSVGPTPVLGAEPISQAAGRASRREVRIAADVDVGDARAVRG